MLLYAATGGGLGHITRSYAIIAALIAQDGGFSGRVRLLVSSSLWSLAAPLAPCPVDIVPEAARASRSAYLAFLEDYYGRHDFRALVLDTFPQGIVGEWAEVGKSLPRVLIARYLKWGAYRARLGRHGGPRPGRVLAVEGLSVRYLQWLRDEADVDFMDFPILFKPDGVSGEAYGGAPDAEKKIMYPQSSSCRHDGWLIVHSGPPGEIDALREFAAALRRDAGLTACRPAEISPSVIMNSGGSSENPSMHSLHASTGLIAVSSASGIYPAERIMSGFKHVVTGGGYNLAAAAVTAPPERAHHMLPFKRRFDSQALRIARINAGCWLDPSGDGARVAAEWLESALGKFL
jgi:hypothetical protein